MITTLDSQRPALHRKTFWAIMALFLGMRTFLSASEPITGATVGPASVNKATLGDIWTPTWADDDSIYVVQDDSSFPDGTRATMAISKLEGEDPKNLLYTTINKMQEYGKDHGIWKAVGIISIDGVLYVSINRWGFVGTDRKVGQMGSVDSSIIKSTDHGKTWVRTVEENTSSPMFPGVRFSNPVFIQYGKNASATAHGSDRYVYAVSNDGFWSHGNQLFLGRVLRSKIGDLNGADWEFYRRSERDGKEVTEWVRDSKDATAILSDPDNVGWTNVMYNPQAGRYLMGQWYWQTGRWHDGTCTWILREAPTPWGPWTTFATKVWDMYDDYYFPCFVPKFISEDGLHLSVFTAGWFKYQAKTYRLSVVPLDLQTNRSLAASVSHLTFRGTIGQDAPASQTVGVTLGKKVSKEVTIDASPSWLKASVERSGNETRVVNQVDMTGLAPGLYSGQVKLSSSSEKAVKTFYTVQLKVQQSHVGIKADPTNPGLRYQCYASSKLGFDVTGLWSQLPKFSNLDFEPQLTGVCELPTLRFSEGVLPEGQIAIRYEGLFVARYSGEYTFYLTSQEGSRLILADETVIDADGVHSPYEGTGTIWLQQGLHPIVIEFFRGGSTLPQRSKIGYLDVAVRGPGMARRPLEAGDLVHAAP